MLPLFVFTCLLFTVSSGADGTLDAPCLANGSCIVQNAYCNQRVCKCRPNYFEKTDQCAERIDLGRPCSTGESCLDENSDCQDGVCVCKPGFFMEGNNCGKILSL